MSVTEGTLAQAEIDPRRADELIRGGAELVDTRRDYEWEGGRIPGARHIEVNRITTEASSLPRETPLVFYCRTGSRSAMIAEAFRLEGFDAYSVAGGIEAWAAAGLEIEGGEIRQPLPAS
jgi:rhodanese-related sulfurtransferase